MLQNGMYKAFLERLPVYLNYLYIIENNPNMTFISSTFIARALGLGEVQVRKDLAMVCKKGRPKVGYSTKDLINDLEKYLCYDIITNVIIVGCGKLGQALLQYQGFLNKGLELVCGFDVDEKIIGNCGNKNVYHLNHLPQFCKENKIKVGIITVPKEFAQEVADLMIASGINKIWNFSPIRLNVSNDVMVQNEDLASELALFAKNFN